MFSLYYTEAANLFLEIITKKYNIPINWTYLPVVMLWLELIQAIVTVCAGVLSEKPAARAASRPMLLVLTSCITVPYIM
jgi:hypothetical protein